jgi:hypothetical protein
MNSQVFLNSKVASTTLPTLPRTPASLPEVDFGPGIYRIVDPPADWFQRSPEDAPECGKCGDTLTFVFRPRIEEHFAQLAGAYQTPVAIRCRCFLAEVGPTPLTSVYRQQLSRSPIPIVPKRDNDDIGTVAF